MTTERTLNRPLVMAAVMAALFMIAIEATIVSTAMPKIAGQLGDLHLYAWVFASFLLTQTATTVVFGKLSDQYGRKPVLLVGIAIFLVGSVLCGFAWSIPSLIAFRLLQGAGAGAIQPVSLTIVGDLYPGKERGRVQGYLASIWGVSSVLGPLAGGLIIQHLDWAWIFWINVPVGIVAALLFMHFLFEDVTQERHSVDVLGAVLFSVSVGTLMVALTELGTANHALAVACVGLFAVSTGLFVWQEGRAREPMVAFRLWGRRVIATTNAATLMSGMAIIGLTAFLPMYVQGVLGRSALVAGFALTMMVLGWPVGATLATRNAGRFGLRATMLFGGSLMPVGAFGFVLLAPGVSPVVAGLSSLVMGFGMGFFSTSAIVLIQGSVGWAERGAATASNIFSRSLGSTLGATVLGAVLNISLSHRGAGAPPVDIDGVRQLLDQSGQGLGDAAMREALAGALHLAFWAVFLIAAATFLLATLVPNTGLKQPAEKVPAEA